jgi:zinc transport system substrate-binding protein
MFSMRLWLVICLGLSLTLMEWTESDAKPTVYVVNYPLQYFTERIGAEHVQVVFPAPADADPAFWKPDAHIIAAFQAADLIIINGATYSKWLTTASLPKAKIVNTSEGFKANYIEIKDMVTHSHGPSGEHSHTGTAFTTWLDFRQAAQQAQAIMAALSQLLPEQKKCL